MTRRLLFARAEEVREGIDGLGLPALWHSLVAVHVERVDPPAKAAILADLPLRDPAWTADLLDGLSMSERSVLYEYSLAHVDRRSRKSEGQFFTPDDVAQFLAARAREFPAGTWIDPCCGIGNLSFWLAAEQAEPARFLAERLVLVDRDPLALRIACALLATEFGLDHRAYSQLAARSRVADALSDDLPDFDYAILNPPYVVVPRDERFGESAEARDLYAYFITRMLELGSGVVAISPQSFTSGRRFAGFRRMLVRRLATMDVYCFDNVPDNVFRGFKFGSQNTNRVNSTRAAILVGRAGDHPRRHRITPLLRWRAHERPDLLASADDFLAELQPDAERAFPKVGASLIELHRAMLAADQTVGDLLVTSPTDYHLDIPVTPRYFLSAVRRPLDRGHVHRLWFATPSDRDRALLVLNSSLAYWWWRAYEGGITVSRATLASVPVPIAGAPTDLLAALAASEQENVVVKQNAGRRNENVKHPWPLLRRLNALVAPGFVDALLATHANSNLNIVDEGARLTSRAPARSTSAQSA